MTLFDLPPSPVPPLEAARRQMSRLEDAETPDVKAIEKARRHIAALESVRCPTPQRFSAYAYGVRIL